LVEFLVVLRQPVTKCSDCLAKKRDYLKKLLGF
jgi:hypothetical protein